SPGGMTTRDAAPPVGDPDGDCFVIDQDEETKRMARAAKDQELAKKVMSSAATLVRASNGLPKTADNYALLRSFGAFSELVEQQEKRVASLISRVLSSAGSRVRLPRVDRNADFEHFYDRVIEANDGIVERAGIVLDELERSRRGVQVKVPKAVIDAESTRRTLSGGGTRPAVAGLGTRLSMGGDTVSGSGELHTAKQRDQARIARVSATIVKPQKAFGFGASIDNSSSKYLPIMKQKHHAMERRKVEGLVVRDEDGAERANASAAFASDEAVEAHPYAYELDHDECPEEQLKSVEPQKYGTMESTPLTVVDTLDGLKKLVETLNKEKEFAIDLEAHSHRSFSGIVCLMQISTRSEDFIVDPFPLWSHMHLLNEPFSDPNILKVFHGADSDVIWLQRDFNIFVRNIFDTFRAMKRDQGWTKFNLAALVERFCDGHQLQKEYQLADWRIRPLPADYVSYARGDTHFLLYCKDMLRERLLESGNEQANLMRAVYTDGVELSRKLYEKAEFDADGYRSLISTRKNFNNRQLYALAELWRWRDATAREEDESTTYVLPSHMMIHIAEALPREMQGILACCSPVPILVKQHLIQLHRIIYAARDRPLEKTVTLSTRTTGTQGAERGLFEAMVDEANRMTKIKSVLRSSLDFTHCAFNEEIGAMIKMHEEDKVGIDEKPVTDTFLSVIGVFKVEEEGMEEKPKKKEKKKKQPVAEKNDEDSITARLAAINTALEEWATPYERYSIALQESEKKREEARIAEELKRKERGNVDKEGRPLFSHHDPVVCRKPVFKDEAVETIDINKRKEGDEDGLLTADGKGLKRSAEGKWDESQILTKKKLKLMEKKRKAAADWSVEGPSQKKKEKTDDGKKKAVKKEEPQEEEEDGEVDDDEEEVEKKPFNYAEYDPKALFELSQDEANAQTYSPHNGSGRYVQNARGRGAKRGKHGGHTRAVGMSMSFGGRGGRGGGDRGGRGGQRGGGGRGRGGGDRF
ncbi:crn-3, partial [Pristionchus pacificus]